MASTPAARGRRFGWNATSATASLARAVQVCRPRSCRWDPATSLLPTTTATGWLAIARSSTKPALAATARSIAAAATTVPSAPIAPVTVWSGSSRAWMRPPCAPCCRRPQPSRRPPGEGVTPDEEGGFVPYIPHPLSEERIGQCRTCHGLGGLKPYPEFHEDFPLDACTDCHQLAPYLSEKAEPSS